MTENEAIEGFKIDNAFLGESEKGTVERNNFVIKVLEEIQEYRAIGTVEECRKAVERMKPKRPNIENRRIRDCIGIPHDFTVTICPACGQQLEKVKFRKYPCECGQAIDWSKENGEKEENEPSVSTN